jgi:hypothetical protein
LPNSLEKTAVFEMNQFLFKQSNIYDANHNGWCMGISLAVLAHLYVNNDFCRKFSAMDAFEKTMAYTSVLNLTYDKKLERAIEGFSTFRTRLQEVNSSPGVTVNTSSLSTGPTARLLGMAYIRERRRIPHGSMYRRLSVQSKAAHHCGVIVWDANDAFVFDPNVGGVLFRWSPAKITRLPQAVDMLLERRYTECGYSFVKVKTCGIWDVDPEFLPMDLGRKIPSYV